MTATRRACCRCSEICIFVPEYSVYEERKEPWVSITGEAIDHYD